MDEFIERFKRWLDQEKEEGHITDWGLTLETDGWGVGIEGIGDEEEFFVTIEPA